MREHARLLFTVEVLFLVAFAGWAAVRAANPEAVGTEKPMELAFINAILGSPTFPPHDPWLSGYAISYYYFGYVIVAMLAKITGTAGSVAFNLGIALIFALSAIGAYGLVYNLLSGLDLGNWRSAIGKNNTKQHSAQDAEASQLPRVRRPSNHLAALLGPLYVLILSNLEGFLHSLHGRGLLWRKDAAGEWISAFWKWLDINDLKLPPQEPLSWIPERFWWWWRASRVVQDYDLAGNPKEIIDEFPFFSFLLADLHPHVLVMPFTFLVMALALNLLLGSKREADQNLWMVRHINLRTLALAGLLALPLGILLLIFGALNLKVSLIALGILALIAGGLALVRLRGSFAEHGLATLKRKDLGKVKVGVPVHIQPAQFLLASVALGGLAFLNTWDFPVYVALFAAAYAVGRVIQERKRFSQAVGDFVWLGLALGISGAILYLPFYLGFSSQVGGILPNLIYPTRAAHLWVMFGTLLLPILAFLVYLSTRKPGRGRVFTGFKLVVGLILALWVFTYILSIAITILPGIGDFYLASIGASTITEVFTASLTRRALNLGGLLTLAALLALALGALLRLEPTDEEEVEEVREEGLETQERSPLKSLTSNPLPLSPAYAFALLLIIWGGLLVLAPEFVFLRDLFGWRMNTIFKFYFQAWLLWSIAAAYVSVVLWRRLRGGWGWGFRLGLTLLLIMGLFYPVLSLPNKTNGFLSFDWTLDSSAYYARQAPEEMEAIRWLQLAPTGVVAEAVPPEGGSYTQFGRAATFSGMPGVLGWIGHENQWRGSGQAVGARQSDLERLYCSRDWEEAKGILDKYAIRYVIVGSLERSTYLPNQGGCPSGLNEVKFQRYLSPVFQLGPVTIYEYSGEPGK